MAFNIYLQWLAQTQYWCRKLLSDCYTPHNKCDHMVNMIQKDLYCVALIPCTVRIQVINERIHEKTTMPSNFFLLWLLHLSRTRRKLCERKKNKLDQLPAMNLTNTMSFFVWSGGNILSSGLIHRTECMSCGYIERNFQFHCLLIRWYQSTRRWATDSIIIQEIHLIYAHRK